MIRYQYDQESLTITEQKNGNDVEFVFHVLQDKNYVDGLHQVRNFFEKNTIYTDVLFYTHPNNEFQVIVRQDYYVDFVLSLFKHRVLESITWVK